MLLDMGESLEVRFLGADVHPFSIRDFVNGMPKDK